MTPHFRITLNPIGSNFMSRTEPRYQKSDQVSPPQKSYIVKKNNEDRLCVFSLDIN